MCMTALRCSVRKHDPWHAHNRVRELCSWQQVAEAYDYAIKIEHSALRVRNLGLKGRGNLLKRWQICETFSHFHTIYSLGKFARPIHAVFLVVDIFFAVHERLIPR